MKMTSVSLSASRHSKPLLHLLKPQTPKPIFILTHHLCTIPTSNPIPTSKPIPNPTPSKDSSSFTTQLLLQPNDKDSNLDQLRALLFPNASETNILYNPYELYKLAKDQNVRLNLKAAGMLIRTLTKAGMEDEALIVFNELSSELKNTHIRNVVIRMLLNGGRVDDALKVLDEMLQPEDKFRADAATVDIVLSVLLRKEQRGRSVGEEEVVGLVLRFGEHCVFPSSRVVTRLVSVLCRNGKVGLAWDVLRDVKKMGGDVEAASCNVVLSGLARGSDIKKVSEVMVEMEEMGVKLNLKTLGSLIDSLCKSGRVDAALEVFRMMGGGVNGVSAKPDVIIHNSLIDGLCKVGRPEEGLCLMEEMRSTDGCAPDTVTYNCLIGGFNKIGDIDRGREMFENMKEEGIPPNAVSLNTMVDGLCRHGRLNTALEFFKEMERDGLIGNAVTYTILITSFCDASHFSKAMELFGRMLGASESPTDAKVYHCLISGLTLAGRMEDASFVVSKLKEAGFSMDNASYNVMINGFFRENKPEKIHEMIEDMEASRVKPDSATYNTLLASLSKAGDLRSAQKVLDRMMDEGIVPTVVTFGTLIHAHCLDGNIDQAMRIFRDMGSKSKIPSSAVIYNDLIESMFKKNDVEQALCLMDDMKDKGVRPNIQTFNALFKGLRVNNLLEKASQFMNQMVEQACKPDYI